MSYQEYVTQKADMLKAISHPIRLCLVKKLSEQEICNVSYFTECMGVNQSTVSQHLAKLRDIGIVGCIRDGQNINYYLKNEEVKKIVKCIFEEGRNE